VLGKSLPSTICLVDLATD